MCFMNGNGSEERLQRIEVKLDRLSELVGDLARVDEKASSIGRRVDRHEYRLDMLEENQREVAEAVTKNSGTAAMLERAAWVIFAAAVAGAAAWLN